METFVSLFKLNKLGELVFCMREGTVKQKLDVSAQKELGERIQIIGKIDNEELGFAVKNNLLKWWELRAWQESKEMKK